MWRVNLKLVIVAVMMLLAACVPALASEPNLIAHWTFDEGTGTTAYDSVGSHHGTLVGNPTWTTGQVDGALSLDGMDDYVDLGLGAELDLERTDQFTLSAWYRGTGSSNTVLSKMDRAVSFRGYDMFIQEGYVVAHIISTWTSNAIRVDGTLYPVTDSSWHHLVVTYDGSSSASGLRIYVDAMEEMTSVYRDSLSSTIRNSASFKVGARSDAAGTTQHLNGTIDDVRVYNRALAAEEIEQLYWQGIGAVEFAVYCLTDAIAQKQDLLKLLNETIEKEWLAYEALDEAFETGDYDDLNKGDIVKSKQKIHSAIQHQEQSLNALEKSIEKLEDSLSALGYTSEPNDTDD